jgi:uncharacterized OB-fold protein
VTPARGEARPRRAEPPETALTRPFWNATRERRLLLQWCTRCNVPIHYPRECCPRCLHSELEWRPASGRGEVYAVSVMHRAGNPLMQDRVPYAVALVDLEEGVRFMSNIVGCAPSEVRVGMPVSVTWEELSDGRQLPLFAPVGTQPSTASADAAR